MLKFGCILHMDWFKCRNNEQLSRCGDVRSSRNKLMAKLKKLIDN